jgi:GTP cyclohydrolase I
MTEGAAAARGDIPPAGNDRADGTRPSGGSGHEFDLPRIERAVREILVAIGEDPEPRGVVVVIEAEHLCMTMRGVRKPGARTVTSAVRGAFRDNNITRAEAMSIIYGRH